MENLGRSLVGSELIQVNKTLLLREISRIRELEEFSSVLGIKTPIIEVNKKTIGL